MRRRGADCTFVPYNTAPCIDAKFPLIDGPAAALRLHALLAREMLGEESKAREKFQRMAAIA